jgi:twitching motility protein PilT
VRAIVAQQLIPRKDGEGRVAAIEILTGTPEARTALRDPARLGELAGVMSRAEGMQTFAEHLAELVSSGVVAPETAQAAGYDVPAPKGKKGRG